jgi:hypothetical protein
MNIYTLKSKFLTFFGDLKYFKYPPCIVYHPITFKIKGSDTRKVINVIQDGDIIMRGYDCYLDGLFIPGKYSHTGLYTGNGKIIHAIAEGVSEIDIIDYLRCDRFCLMRPIKGQELAIIRAREFLENKTPYDFDFSSDNNKLYCHEFAARCYSNLNIVKKVPTLFKGMIKGEPVWLAESFLESSDFTVILCKV